MARWCYRPCKIVHENGEETWDIRAFYYNDDQTPRGWSQDAVYAFGETLEELKSDIERMVADINTKEPLVLYVYACKECKEKDARMEKDRDICDDCLDKQLGE